MSANLKYTLLAVGPILLIVGVIVFFALAGPTEVVRVKITDSERVTRTGGGAPGNPASRTRYTVTEVDTDIGERFGTGGDDDLALAVGGVYECGAEGFKFVRSIFIRHLVDCVAIEPPPPPAPSAQAIALRDEFVECIRDRVKPLGKNDGLDFANAAAPCLPNEGGPVAAGLRGCLAFGDPRHPATSAELCAESAFP